MAPGAAGPAPRVDPDLVSGQLLMGSLDTAFLLAYSFGVMYCGHIAEAHDLRLFLSVGMGLASAALMLMAAAYWLGIHAFGYFIFVSGLCGALQGTGWPAVVAVVGSWAPPGERGLTMGVWNAHVSVGNILGSLVAVAGLSLGMHGRNWPLAYSLPAVVMFAVGLFVLLQLKPTPESAGLPPTPGSGGGPGLSSAASHAFSAADDEVADAVSVTPSSASIAREGAAAGASSLRRLRRFAFVRALLIPGVVPFAAALFFAKLVAYAFMYWLPQFLSSVGYSSEASGTLSVFFDLGAPGGELGVGGVTVHAAPRRRNRGWRVGWCARRARLPCARADAACGGGGRRHGRLSEEAGIYGDGVLAALRARVVRLRRHHERDERSGELRDDGAGVCICVSVSTDDDMPSRMPRVLLALRTGRLCCERPLRAYHDRCVR